MIDDTYPPLTAWLYGERVADLLYDGVRGIHLTYTSSAIVNGHLHLRLDGQQVSGCVAV